MRRYPIAKPYITDSDRKAVLAVLKTGYLSLGPKHKELEEAFAKKIGTKYACTVSSGTAGLHLAMIAAGIGSGDEVITSPFSFVASANCILYVGAKPVFVDIDPVTYNIDPAKIEEKITKRTKAILPVHIFGQPTDMDPVVRLAKKYKLKIIEDACESVGAKYKGKHTGTFGESAVFAFYPNKQMTTGEGGMIVTNDRKTYKLCASLRNQGRAENMQWLDHQYLGYNYRMDEMSAALGLAQLAKLDYMINERIKIAALYNKYFSKHSNLIAVPQTPKNNIHTWFVYVVRVSHMRGKGPLRVLAASYEVNNSGLKRNRIIESLAKQGISTKPYLPSIHLFSFYKDKFGFKKGDFPISEAVSNSTIALPFYIGLKESDIKYIVNKFIAVVKSHQS